jgi:uncharacterized membrane protein YccC
MRDVMSDRWGFAVRTTAAAVLALLAATSLGLSHPHWAAMTVWLVAQPTRGLILERSLARLAGSALGAALGFLLVRYLSDTPVGLVFALVSWVACCAISAPTACCWRGIPPPWSHLAG